MSAVIYPCQLAPEPHHSMLRSHIESFYSLAVKSITPLDYCVYRVSFEPSSTTPSLPEAEWIIRAFPQSTCPESSLRSTARLLDYLHRGHAYPAEPLATETLDRATSSFGEYSVLVTKFIPGAKPKPNKVTYARLGKLLGKLHSLPQPPSSVEVEGKEGTKEEGEEGEGGGAWHHLCPTPGSTPEDERDAAQRAVSSLLAQPSASKALPAATLAHLKALLAEIASLASLTDLPHALVHADFCPSNTILFQIETAAAAADDEASAPLCIIDWQGAGYGPRLASLGWLLWAGGARHLGLVNVVLKMYGAGLAQGMGEGGGGESGGGGGGQGRGGGLRALKGAEMRDGVLETAIGQRALTIRAWEIAAGRRVLVDEEGKGKGKGEGEQEGEEWLREWKATVASIAERAREVVEEAS